MTKDKYYIVEAFYPFTGMKEVKKRPVIILTKAQSKFKFVICGFITSRIFEDLGEFDYILQPTIENGLAITSLIKLYKLAVFEEHQLGEIIGQLSIQDSIEIKKRLIKLFNL